MNNHVIKNKAMNNHILRKYDFKTNVSELNFEYVHILRLIKLNKIGKLQKSWCENLSNWIKSKIQIEWKKDEQLGN